MSVSSFMGSPTRIGLHARDETRFEGVVDLVCDDEAFGGDAGLSAVDAARAHGGFDGEVEVGGRHHDERVAAAELENGFFDEPAGLGADGAAGGFAAGDGDGGDALVGEDVFDLVELRAGGSGRCREESRRGGPATQSRGRTAGRSMRASAGRRCRPSVQARENGRPARRGSSTA